MEGVYWVSRFSGARIVGQHAEVAKGDEGYFTGGHSSLMMLMKNPPNEVGLSIFGLKRIKML